ncbi:hypothetical protein WR25_03002 [Diploscapter pachys]|uniref:Uncharacterized protein n=1 Tax=Diploscapter pachys TaxID=2018661 RepID=A0A2A2KUJ7_9BILA|nr:hypothetical protein WR25_03002 [Diploscapter pachys]
MFVPFKRKCRSTKRETFECDRQAEKLEEVNDKRAKGERQNVGGVQEDMCFNIQSPTRCMSATWIWSHVLQLLPREGSGQIGSLKLLTRPPNGSGKKGSKKTTTTTAQPEVEEMPDEEYETTERTTRKPEKKRLSSYKKTTPSQPPETTTRANIWDKFTVGQKAKPTPKYIPFWQRLLSTTTKSPRIEDISKTEEKETAEAEETESTQLPEEEVYESTFVTEEPEVQETTQIAESTIIQKSYQKSNGDKKNSNTESPSQKHTFRPLPVTTPAPPGPEMIAFQKPGGGEQSGTAENGGNRRTSTNYNIRTRLLEQIPAKSMVPIDTLRNEHWKVNHFGISAAARPDDPLSILLG